ncbi:hypothetical protein PV04_10667 [Phialophora macrospora]|uniref:Uncharacterized protein n=1 Tax=Phialophora macrospora TaxID=1851006 RepID=A0A0D2FR89_9EURO|nr:hypothetical protein PV04_10667 [Phialophora macrospora]
MSMSPSWRRSASSPNSASELAGTPPHISRDTLGVASAPAPAPAGADDRIAELEDNVQAQDISEGEGSEYWTARESPTTEHQLSPTRSHASSTQQSNSTDSSDGGVPLSGAFDEHGQSQSQSQSPHLETCPPPILPHAEAPETDDVDSSEEEGEEGEGEGDEGEEEEQEEKETVSPHQATYADQLEGVNNSATTASNRS